MKRASAVEIENLEQIEKDAGIVSAIREPAPGAPWNPVEEAFLRRRSVRKYRPRQVPAHLIRRILEIGRFAPSQGNCQPWKFVVVRDREMIARMEAHCVGEAKKLTAAFNYSRYPKGTLRHWFTKLKAQLINRLNYNGLHPVPVQGIAAVADGALKVFHNAPTVILLLVDQRGIGRPDVDIGIVGTNILMAAQSLGLATCWIGFSEFLNSSKELSAQLGAEWPYTISEAIVLGYPIGDPTQRHIPRQTHEIAWWEGGKKEILY